ncbi:hypothetical protein EGW08_017172, partial [Elysia chlorotica]
HCMSRPQHKRSCGISSLVSCWNFLFSTLGYGSLKPLTQETAMSILGFQQPYDKIKFGAFTGNLALIPGELNTNFRVKGKCYFLYKPQGRNRTPGVTPDLALTSLQRGLRDPNMTFIYHCKNHYFCPIGYEDSPTHPQDAYRSVPDDKKTSWILIGETSKMFPAIHCKKWEDICTDLNTEFPEYYDIRREWKGVRRRKSGKSTSGNLHCIMAFQKCNTQDQDMVAMTTPASTCDSDDGEQTDSTAVTKPGENSGERHRGKHAAGKKRRRGHRRLASKLKNEGGNDTEDEDMNRENVGKKGRVKRRCRKKKFTEVRPNNTPNSDYAGQTDAANSDEIGQTDTANSDEFWQSSTPYFDETIQNGTSNSDEGRQSDMLNFDEGRQIGTPYSDEAIQIGTPNSKEAIQIGTPNSKEAIQIGTPNFDEAIQISAPNSEEAIQIGTPYFDETIQSDMPNSDEAIQNDLSNSDEGIQNGTPNSDEGRQSDVSNCDIVRHDDPPGKDGK